MLSLAILSMMLIPAWDASATPQTLVRDHGAIGDGAANDTAAVQKAIDACAVAGGGTVYFTPGAYRCGSLHLKSRVTLYLDNGAILKGSPEPSDYEPQETLPFNHECDDETSYFRHALIGGEDLEHIAIAGFGTIDSGFTKRHGPKPIALKRCRFVDIRDVHILNAPNYAVSLLGSDYVNIDGVTILNAFADGIDPDSCKNVRISNCHIESVDDAIVPKASFALGERRICENITVANCFLSTRCNAFKLGTEGCGGFARIAVSNCVITGLKGKSPALSGIALESVDGAVLDGVTVSNIAMSDVRAPIFIRIGNRDLDAPAGTPGTVRNVSIDNITATRASLACSITGIPGQNVENVSLSNICVQFIGGNPRQASDTPVPEVEDHYPESIMFGPLPAYALYGRHIRNLTLSNLDFSYAPAFWRLTTAIYRDIKWSEDDTPPSWSEPGDAGHALFLDDVRELGINGLHAQPSADAAALIRVNDVRDALLCGMMPLDGTKTLLEVAGAQSAAIQLSGNAVKTNVKAVSLLKDVDPTAVRINNP